MSLWRNFVYMLFRAARRLQTRPRRPFIHNRTHHASLSPDLEVHYTEAAPTGLDTPPVLQRAASHAQPDPAFVANTIAKALRHRAAAVALVQGGRHNSYLVCINTSGSKRQSHASVDHPPV